MANMDQIGVVANARNFWPDRAEFDALGINAIRTIVYNNDEFDRALVQARPGTTVVALLNSEHEQARGYDNWSSVVLDFATRFAGRGVHAVECGNELDIWGEPPELGARLVREAMPILAPRGIKTLLSSVAGADWQGWLAQAANRCRDYYDGACFHPYGQRPDGFSQRGQWGFGDMRDAILRARNLAQKPIWLTEWGVKIGDADGEERQAMYLEAGVATIRSLGPSIVPFAAYFCWTDAVGAPSERGEQAFGLRREDGSRRPAWDTFKRLSGASGAVVPTGTTEVKPMPSQPATPPVVPTPSVWADAPAAGLGAFAFGFAQWANAEPTLIGQPHDADEFGAAPGISQQRTTRGLLTWADLKSGQVMSFLDAKTGKRYIWDGKRGVEVKRDAPVATPSRPETTIGVPWTKTQLITNGFSTPAQWGIAAPRPLRAVCWHSLEGSLAGAIATWNTGVAGAHLVVCKDGTVVLTCAIDNVAWHAGTDAATGRTAFWKKNNINPYSIGVELEGFARTGFTQAQIDACIKIARWAKSLGIKHEHTFDQIDGHHLHSEISNQRSDPGPHFSLDHVLREASK